MRRFTKTDYFSPSGIDTIMFDFDGTLCDTHSSVLWTFRLTLSEVDGHGPIPSFHSQFSSMSVADIFRHSGTSDPEALTRIERRYNTLYRKIACQKARLFPRVKNTLDRLKGCGYRLVIATNESRANLDLLLKHFSIEHFFHATCCADEVDRPKPFPDMGRKLLAETDAVGKRALMVGDSLCDIEMAKQMSMHSCAVGWGGTDLGRLCNASPDWAVEAFPDILDILAVQRTISSVRYTLDSGRENIAASLAL